MNRSLLARRTTIIDTFTFLSAYSVDGSLADDAETMLAFRPKIIKGFAVSGVCLTDCFSLFCCYWPTASDENQAFFRG